MSFKQVQNCLGEPKQEIGLSFSCGLGVGLRKSLPRCVQIEACVI